MDSVITTSSNLLTSENLVSVRSERYEELVTAEARLKILEEAHRTMKSYELDNLLALMFGKDGKEC